MGICVYIWCAYNFISISLCVNKGFACYTTAYKKLNQGCKNFHIAFSSICTEFFITFFGLVYIECPLELAMYQIGDKKNMLIWISAKIM